MSVFISYSSKDSEFIDRLSNKLIKNRIRIWLDKWEMKPGDSIIDKIQDGLTESSFLLVVLSKNSIVSEWCRKELNSGLMRELDEKQVVVIPILLEDCEVPIFLKEKVYADFRNSFDEGFHELLRPLSKLTSEHMGRSIKNGIITDYSIDWGLRNDLYYLDIDLINWYEKEKKSILLQIYTVGCKVVTERFMRQAEYGLNGLINEAFIAVMATSETFLSINPLLRSNEIYHEKVTTVDPKLGLEFSTKIRGVLMGEDDGNDVLLNLVDFLEILDQSRTERVRMK